MNMVCQTMGDTKADAINENIDEDQEDDEVLITFSNCIIQHIYYDTG